MLGVRLFRLMTWMVWGVSVLGKVLVPSGVVRSIFTSVVVGVQVDTPGVCDSVE